MQFNPDIHHRRSIRLKDYDYSQSGAYFITICTEEKECLFGEIRDGNVQLTDAGNMVEQVWADLPIKYSGLDIDAFVIMPNHMHGIIILNDVGAGPCACPSPIAGQPHKDRQPQPTNGRPQYNDGRPQGAAPTRLSVPDIVHRFKSFTTAQYRLGVMQNHWQPFNGKLWQRNYYEHIIRSETEHDKIREYIMNNPINWSEDENYVIV